MTKKKPTKNLISSSSNCDDGNDLSKSDIKNNKFKNNLFVDLNEDTIEISDKDDDYASNFIIDTFEIDNNGILKSCNCTSKMEDNEYMILKEKFYKYISNTSICFTNHIPPIFGNKVNICSGNLKL